MSSAMDLGELLGTMNPQLSPEVWTFATTRDRAVLGQIRVHAMLEEEEGLSIVCLLRDATRLGLRHEGRFKRITLAVHSSLMAVGFIAAVSAKLAAAGIPCNVVSAYHHDHLFVPSTQAARAVRVLRSWVKEQTGRSPRGGHAPSP